MHETLISTAEVLARLGDPNLVTVDLRHDLMQPQAWGSSQFAMAHIPGAQFVHLDRDLSGPGTGKNGRHPLPSPGASAALFGRLGIGDGTQVVVYDQDTGSFAARLWWMLRRLGHRGAAVMDGGFARWVAEGRPTTNVVEARAPASFVVRSPEAPVTVHEVLANLADASMLLIDARAPERFRGEVEPLDPVAGHIPGAVNRRSGANLAADGTFKPAAVLRAEFKALLGGRSPSTVVNYCGSGVTACQNILAMEIAGLSGARLYAGSWSEWCADPARGIARGEA